MIHVPDLLFEHLPGSADPASCAGLRPEILIRLRNHIQILRFRH